MAVAIAAYISPEVCDDDTACGSALTFAFAVLMHLAGEEVAQEVAEGMVAVI